ncbi:hypothetical protein Taro_016582 [Colocasia esculenta]|uniref:Uncharacterized protein n=1 Tax=Colocasia esculenta TaxID=4460 RepID=A0A843UQN0_COLES|nr:hypothetical protein [Colocasia esculenta]
MGQCVDTSTGGVDTRSASQHFLGQTGGVCRHGMGSTRVQVVSTRVQTKRSTQKMTRTSSRRI